MEGGLELLTFVVPCYNVEKCIQRCLDSIYACDLSEEQYEVICINDGSSDGTQEILTANQSRRPKLRIIAHDSNKGLGGARNTGIREALGQYIWFVDADDEICHRELREVLDDAISQDLDILAFNYSRVDRNGAELSEERVFSTTPTQSGYLFISSVFGSQIANHMGYVWRFWYKADFLRENQLYFPEHVTWEDTVFMPKSLLAAKRVAAIPDILYSYRINEGSISGCFSNNYPAKSIFDWAFEAGKELLDFSYEAGDPELKMALHNAARNQYINKFPLFLFRTSKMQRRSFYTLIKAHPDRIECTRGQMSFLSRLLTNETIGPMAAEAGAVLYRVTHR